ncbi:MAG: lipid IV(A) 3-deoxy-D-manno-octulosonic acid transferase [Cellvibrionaceae bacterium]
MRQLYSLFLYVITPFILLRLLWRSQLAPAYGKRWGERFGFVPSLSSKPSSKSPSESLPEKKPVIWVHAVSVGETMAAIGMIKEIQKQQPQAQLVITSMTPTGSERVRSEFGDSVYHCYAPYDLPCAVKRFLGRVQPDQLIIIETEIWPNLIHYTHKAGVPIVLVNARMSRRSARGYGRVSRLARPALGKISRVAAQYKGDGARLLKLGVPKERLKVTGSIKFDIAPSPQQRQQAVALHEGLRIEGDRPVWVAASTHANEERELLDAFRLLRRVYPQLLLVIAPRHPERFQQVESLCQQEQLRLQRRTDVESDGVSLHVEVLLLDTMGELMPFFGAADVAFVGGSLVPRGGHNPIEPAVWGLPVLMGPSCFNFKAVVEVLKRSKGLQETANASELASAVQNLLDHDDLRRKRGQAALETARANRGALKRVLAVLGEAGIKQAS